MSLATSEEIKQFLDGLEGDSRANASWRLTGPIFSSPTSHIYVAEYDNGQTVRLAVKATSVEEAKEQVDGLIVGRERLSPSSSVSVPKVVAFREDLGLLAMEWVNGHSLKQGLQKPFTPRNSIFEQIGRAGAWLAAFHGADLEESRPLDPTTMLKNVWEEKERFGDEMPKDILLAISHVEGLSGRLKEYSVPTSLSHGDYKPANVIVSNTSTVSIDLAAKYVDVVVYDLAHFINQLTLGLYHPLCWRWWPRRGGLAQAFLNGYGMPLPDFPLAWMQVTKYIVQWAQFANSAAISSGHYQARSIRHEIATTLRRLPT